MAKHTSSKSPKTPLNSAINATHAASIPYQLRSLGNKYPIDSPLDHHVKRIKNNSLPLSHYVLRSSSSKISEPSYKSNGSIILSPKSQKIQTSLASHTPILVKLKGVHEAAEGHFLNTPEKQGAQANCLLTNFALQAQHSTPVQQRIKSFEENGSTPKCINPYDIIAHNFVVHKEIQKTIDPGVHVQHVTFKIKFDLHEIPVKQLVSVYSTGSTASIIGALGTYDDISQALKGTQLSDKAIAESLFNIMHGEEIADIKSKPVPMAIKIEGLLHNVYYLLCGVEVNRNPSALITNPMFLDLVKKGVYKFTDMADILPMSIEGAQGASRGIGKVFSTPFIKGFKPMDSSETRVFDIESKEVSEMLLRTSKLISKWLDKMHGIVLKRGEYIFGPKLANAVSVIKQAIKDWYDVSLKDFPITADDLGAKIDPDAQSPLDDSGYDFMGAINAASDD